MYYKTSEQEKISLGFSGHECNNGSHFCGLYETEEEKDEIIMGFLRQGLLDKDKVMYVPSESSEKDFRQKFSGRFPDDVRLIIENDNLQISKPEDLYIREGKFSPDHMIIHLEDYFKRCQEQGKRNIRASAEMSWALELHIDLFQLMVYESRLNYFIPGKPWVSICLYNLTKFDGQTIMKVLQTHPYAIGKGGVIIKNPYFIDPDEWLAENAQQNDRQAEN
jgi:hypothetical protein